MDSTLFQILLWKSFKWHSKKKNVTSYKHSILGYDDVKRIVKAKLENSDISQIDRLDLTGFQNISGIE